MDTRSKILIALFLLLVAGTSIWKYHVFFVERDYTIYTLVSCDSESESCFSLACEEGDEECDDTPYKKIEMRAADAPLCDPYSDESCEEPSCGVGNEMCEVIECSPDTLEEGEICVLVSAEEAAEEEVLEDVDSSETE